MNEARRKAYQNLIDSLLTCPSEEKIEILQANLGLIWYDEDFAQYLREWATQTLATLDAKQAYNRANFLYDLNIAFSTLQHGSLATHLEIAITCLDRALTVYNREAYRQKAYPQEWVMTQNALGNAYLYRIKGDKAENVERSIKFYETALFVYTREAYPQQWAITQNGLGNAYLYRIKGDKAYNLERSIAFFQASLEVLTRDAFSQQWAMTQNGLGNAYSERIRGGKAENIERSIAFYYAALSLLTRETFPQDWAQTQNNLANAYRNRIRDEKAENIERSIAFYYAALEVRNREKFPQDWAQTQNNLANAYRNRIAGKKADNLETSIECYKIALEVYTRDEFPEKWAMVQNNLGEAYRNRISGDKADNLERAIEYYEVALQVYTRDNFPEKWAMVHNNLANAYRNRIRGEKADNQARAIERYDWSLENFTRDAYPIDHAETLFNLGVAYQENSQLSQAYNTFAAAIETVESIRGEIIVGGGDDRQKLAEEYNIIYQRMVELCLDMENPTAALEYVERSKTKNLVESFHNARNLTEKAQQISFAEIRDLLAYNEVILEWYITPRGFKVFIVTPDSTQPDVWQSSAQDLQELEEFSQEYIYNYTKEPKEWISLLKSRLEKLSQILHIDELIARLPENCQGLILVPFRYLHLFPLHALTSSRQKADKTVETGCLLELFPGGVRYTPSCQLLQLSQRVNASGEYTSRRSFFAIQNPTEDLKFTDFEVEAIATYFTSTTVLSGQNASKAEFIKQISSLENADIAHFSCHGYFNFLNPQNSALILADARISRDALILAEIFANVRIASADVTSRDEPMRHSSSSTNIDLEKCLTVEEVFNLQLNKCSLVVLSACQTALIDPRNTTDEYIGLPSSFLYAGATSVLGTLWNVDDLSTAILMIKFYEFLLSDSRPAVAVALRESQLWLRDATTQDLVDWVNSLKLIPDERKEEMQYNLAWGQKPENKPYDSPCYWAAFCAVGQ